MADVNSPKEFLNELTGLIDQLDADRAELAERSEKKKSAESLMASMKNSIEKEKARTIKARRADIEAGFDKQIKAVNAELKGVNDKRQKALNDGMRERTREATKGVKQEADAFKNALKAYAGTNKLPAILKTRAYYRIFCPGMVGYIIYLLIFLAVMYFSASMVKQRAAAGLGTGPFFIVGIVAIALLFLYIMIWSNTHVRYRDEIKNCLGIIASIKANERQAKNIEKNIRKAGDDNTYGLHEFDAEIAELDKKKAALESQKAGAVNEFEAVTKDRLTADIDDSYKDKLAERSAEIAELSAGLKEVSDRISAGETRINQEFIPYVGAENLTHERAAALAEMIENGTAVSVSEAVSKLEGK